ncbi:MAG TPA: cell division protein ZapB [Bacteroidetes bacterium]|nr:cell division protein ZapB [Bacteroidota bacterium]
MELHQFEVLENKIVQALQLIEKLKNENATLRSEIASLKEELAQKEEEIAELNTKFEKELDNQRNTSYYQEREAQIRSKIEDMLARLEALEIPL